MGIPSFVSWLKQKKKSSKFKDVWTENVPDSVLSLSIDMNGLIHRALSMVYGYGDYSSEYRKKKVSGLKKDAKNNDIMTAIEHLLLTAIKEIKPIEMLIIAVDGVAPVAKLQQQRQRRYNGAKYRKEEDFDSSVVTPGTPFMFELDVMITDILSKNRSIYPPTIIYSSHLSPGEGEHKIMQYYRDRMLVEGTHVLYGLDADLVMLSLMSPLKGIILKREDSNEMINIDKLADWIKQESKNDELRESAVPDFVAIMSFLGNDFIPHGPTHHSMGEIIEGLMNARNEIGEEVTTIKEDSIREINFDVLHLIIKANVDNQQQLLAEETRQQIFTKPFSYPPKKTKINIFVPPQVRKIENEKNQYEVSTSTFQKDKFYERSYRLGTEGNKGEMIFDYNIFKFLWYNNELGDWTNDDVYKINKLSENMSINYINGVAWCFTYYQTFMVDKHWFYPYFHAPLFSELSLVLEYIVNNKQVSNYLVDKKYDYGPLEQLLSVIPPKSMTKIIPDFLSELVFSRNSEIYDMYPIDVKVEMDGTDKVGLGITLVPKLYINRVINAVDKIKKSNEINTDKWNTIPGNIYKSTEDEKSNYLKYLNIIQKSGIKPRQSEKSVKGVKTKEKEKIFRKIKKNYS